MRTICLVSALLLAVTTPARGGIQLRLSIDPPAELPFIEPSLRVEAVNPDSESAELPLTVALQVTPSGERPAFIAYTGMRGNDRVTLFHSNDGERIILGPGETRDVSFWAGPESPVWFAVDSRLMSPGTYRLQLIADAKLDSDRLENVARAIDQPGLAGPMVSNEVTFIVETPKGEDATVWQMIKEHVTSGGLWPEGLGHRIWAEYPNSRYTAYCLYDRSSEPEISIAAYQAALEKRPSRSWADWYRFSIAERELQLASSLVRAKTADEALAASNRAGDLLRQLAKEALNPYIRREAQLLAERRLWTREGIERSIKIQNGELREVRPYASCVETLPDGQHIFWFGYENTAPSRMTLPIGTENKFTPPPFDRGQPTIFPPAPVTLGARIVTKENAVTWHLHKFSAQASLEKTPPCPADLLERYIYAEPLREDTPPPPQ